MAPKQQTCLYEILGVERSASADKIRSAYRKLALKWHPDKIQQTGAPPDECQEATVRFQDIGRAYEVLGDPSERAWYDSHRFEILSASSEGFSGGTASSADFEFSLWSYFSPAVFSGYGETGLGFYAVYAQVFQKVGEQEKAFVRAYGGPSSVQDAPLLGGLGVPYDQVARFYSYWLGFSTVKDFSWCDEYKTTLAPNRKVRRLMEEENKKVRRKARREFNEAVRQLAAFVKKRDKRVMERQLEVQRLNNEKELMSKLRRKQAEEEKLRKARQFQEAEWTRVSNEESASGDEHGFGDDEKWGQYQWDRSQWNGKGIAQRSQEELYCIVCNKKFRSEKQWKNHEKSKKHTDRAALLKKSFVEEEGEEEDKDLMELLSKHDANGTENDLERRQFSNGGLRFYSGTGLSDEENAKCSGKVFTYSSNLTRSNERDTCAFMETSTGEPDSGSEDRENDVNVTDDDESTILLAMLESQKSREQKTVGRRSMQNVSDATDGSEEDGVIASMLDSYSRKSVEDVNNGQEGKPLCAGVGTANIPIGGHARSDEESEDLDPNSPKEWQSRSVQSMEAAAMTGSHAHPSEMTSLEQSFDSMNTESTAGERNETIDFSKGAVRNGARGEVSEMIETKFFEKLQTEGTQQSRTSKGSKSTNKLTAAQGDQGRKQAKGRRIQGSSKASSNKCEICGEEFESRNQLFKHVKDVNHSVLRTR